MNLSQLVNSKKLKTMLSMQFIAIIIYYSTKLLLQF